ncbi:hypothetical protein FHR83_006645 [Actinoplanes campanulatus]|uniref:RecT family protein n=1 Tax=Actinoplanes campanulatus TaxID=113559 RepID=A0A7W5ANB3_9ACTN|nr:hypothetical protein [Actinoplanes campanulatus]MBB3098939.1 hypothetical protein [Actinoplanes campanulatus]GGN39759.1 hypothetical protein GCM10010109_68110 [Actinoplanes campanulatus]
MTDLAVRDNDNLPTSPAVPQLPVYQQPVPSPLMQWAMEAREAAKIAESLSRTSFVPASLRGKPADVTAAILAGQELGLQPMATLRSMDVIQGTPALRAHAQRGLVQSHGHKVWIEKGASKERVVMWGQRREADGTYGEPQQSVWDIDRAKELGLTGKEQWKKQPQTMLTARATGEICRLVASDVLHAMPYNSEELSDGAGDLMPVRAAARVNAQEVLANAAAAREQAKPISGPPAVQQPQVEAGGESDQRSGTGWDDDDSAWDDVNVAQPAGGAQ